MPIVAGIDAFRDAMAGFEDKYVLIGGGGRLPAEIELFSHASWPVDEGFEIVPVPFDGDLSSLSAILLDEDYYGFIREGIVRRHGVPVPDVLHIIPLKMRAHVDLNRRHDGGEHVRRRNLTKHRADVLSLSDLLADGASCRLPAPIANDAREFLSGLDGYAQAVRRKERPRIIEAASFLRRVYGL